MPWSQGLVSKRGLGYFKKTRKGDLGNQKLKQEKSVFMVTTRPIFTYIVLLLDRRRTSCREGLLSIIPRGAELQRQSSIFGLIQGHQDSSRICSFGPSTLLAKLLYSMALNGPRGFDEVLLVLGLGVSAWKTSSNSRRRAEASRNRLTTGGGIDGRWEMGSMEEMRRRRFFRQG